MPFGWVQDADGNPTTNAYAAHEGGAMVPLGGDREHGSHKGYCLGAIVDIFSAVLSGANYGPWVPPFGAHLPIPEDSVGERLGHFLYGGSLFIMVFEPGRYQSDAIQVRLGNQIGLFDTTSDEPSPPAK